MGDIKSDTKIFINWIYKYILAAQKKYMKQLNIYFVAKQKKYIIYYVTAIKNI